MPIVTNNQKEFEKPPTGTYVGTIADVVDLGAVTDTYGTKFKLRVVWMLNKNDSEGKPFQVIRQLNATMGSKAGKESNLYTLVRKVLGTATAPIPYDTDDLVGRSNLLFIEKETATDGRVFSNIRSIMPLEPGQVPVKIPATFVRAQNKTAQPQTPAQPATRAQAPTPQPVESEIPF